MLKAKQIKQILDVAKTEPVLILALNHDCANAIFGIINNYVNLRYPLDVSKVKCSDTIHFRNGWHKITVTYLSKWQSVKRVEPFNGRVFTTVEFLAKVINISQKPQLLTEEDI